MLEKILENLKSNNQYICYSDGENSYTNTELYGYVSNIYKYLLNANPEKKPVAVIGHKDVFMIASFLACSFAGMAYIPLDESLPEGRIETILNQVSPAVVIDKNIQTVMTSGNTDDIDNIYMKDSDIYYIIFTSGSTGEPKGVKILYRNLKSCVKWLEDLCGNEKSVIINQANFSFDLSVADVYMSLVEKCTHFVLPKYVQNDYPLLFKRLSQSNADTAVITPSFAELLLLDKSFNSELLPNFRTVVFCGESLGSRTVKKLYKRFPELRIINCYGPTECTFAVTAADITPEETNLVPIGYPKKDTALYIVDDNLNEVPEGETGEIIIAGASVGEGYVKPELNANRFFRFKSQPAYATGDMGYCKDGCYYCLGRKDKQIKYKGYRIELQEIENAVERLDECENCTVCPLKNQSGSVRKIFAFIQLRRDCTNDSKYIEEKIKQILPEYMMPIIRIVDMIPLTVNGKVDEKKLMEEYV